jgi:iron(III) transport system ATP-binding protein
VVLSVRPEAIHVETAVPVDGRYIQAHVESVMFLGEYIDCYLRIGDQSLRAKVHPQVNVQPGDMIYVTILADYCVALAA